MQPVKIAIPGRYWDSFIYKGSLYLWEVEGTVRTIDWERMISTWPVDPTFKLAMHCAFLRSDFLYDARVRLFLEDPDLRTLFRDKLLGLAQHDVLVPCNDALADCEAGRQDNPHPFPHADLEVYYDKAYVAGASGVHSGSIGTGTTYPISTRSARKWDAPVRRISAAWRALALAAGDDGLFQMDADCPGSWSAIDEPLQVAKEACIDCDWTYWSIFGSSPNGGFLAAFRREDPLGGTPGPKRTADEYPERRLDRLVPSQDLWGHEGYSWGVRDKLCLAADGEIEVIRYTPWDEDKPTRLIGQLALDRSAGDVVSASTAPFGIVVELDEAIVVRTSSGEVVPLPGEPSNWRAFPRARHYANQLHVIKDDCLEILSFNEDYLLDQDKKVAGIRAGREPSMRMRQGR